MTDPQSRTSSALTVAAHGGLGMLGVRERPVPAPGPGQVRIEVAYAGVNFIDVYQRQGVYPMDTPFVLGMEAAGTVEAIGEGAGWAVGDRVAWCMVPGAMSTLAVVPADRLVPVPDEVGLDTAAAALLQGMTAHFLTTSTYPVTEGTTALVHAAAGGVGQLLTQTILAKGGTVVATAGGPAKLDVPRRLGAQHLIDYDAVDDLAAAVRAATDGRGVDVVYDGVGRSTFEASLGSLRRRGMMVLFGAASGQVPPFDVQRLNPLGSLFLTRPSLAAYVAEREELTWRAREVFAALAAGTLRIEIGGRFALADAALAYEALEARRTSGKLLLEL